MSKETIIILAILFGIPVMIYLVGFIIGKAIQDGRYRSFKNNVERLKRSQHSEQEEDGYHG